MRLGVSILGTVPIPAPFPRGETLRILLVDADSKEGFPNLALMKLSAWLRVTNGNEINIDLIRGIPTTAPLEPYDMTYISTIFFQNKERVLDYANQIENVKVGGSGWDLTNKLPSAIDHIMPDYSLYGVDFSMGFTSRGCIRKCDFCVVPEKEGHIRDNAPISEFHHPAHENIILLDNNFQSSPKWRENLTYLWEHGLHVNFNQGLDIRTLTNEFVKELSGINFENWTFRRSTINFAFDDLRYEKQVRDGVRLLNHYGITPRHLSMYMLVGYNTSRHEDKKRLEILKELGVRPYVMRYNRSNDEWLKHFARYVNRRYFEFIEWDDYQNGVLNK
jgi:hypothetical protein